MKRISVWFYVSPSGHEPVKDWLKKLDKNLWEVRSDISDGRIARVLFTVQGEMMVLLHGFVKKSKSTSKLDLDLAKKRRNDVLKQR